MNSTGKLRVAIATHRNTMKVLASSKPTICNTRQTSGRSGP